MSQIASDAKIQSAMTKLGMTAPLTNMDDSQVLKAILVALGNVTGGSGSVDWGSIGGTLSNQTDLAAALAAKLDLAGGTMTGALVNSTNGAASTPALKLTGSLFSGGTGTTTMPQFLVQPTGATAATNWNTNGSAVGWNLNAVGSYPNYPSVWAARAAGNFVAELTTDGTLTAASGIAFNNSARDVAIDNGFARHSSGNGVNFKAGGSYPVTLLADGLRCDSASQLSFTDGTSYNGTRDVGVARGSAGYIKITDGTTGVGTLQFGVHSALGAETVTGYITVKDGAGTTRKLAVIS
jgi:hypothetical protein